jgi:hypothetical protein
MPGAPRLRPAALRPLALPQHDPPPAPTRTTPPLLLRRLSSRRTPQTHHVIKTKTGRSCTDPRQRPTQPNRRTRRPPEHRRDHRYPKNLLRRSPPRNPDNHGAMVSKRILVMTGQDLHQLKWLSFSGTREQRVSRTEAGHDTAFIELKFLRNSEPDPTVPRKV